MGIAERIYEIVKDLPEAAAAEVLGYVQAKCNRSPADSALTSRRAAALALMDKHAGRFKAVKFDRAELYDRACLR